MKTWDEYKKFVKQTDKKAKVYLLETEIISFVGFEFYRIINKWIRKYNL